MVADRHRRRLLVGLGRRAGAGPPDVRGGRRPSSRRRTAPSATRRPPRSAIRASSRSGCRSRRSPSAQLTKMVVLRKTIADGTARPEEIADFEADVEGAGGDPRQGLRHRGASDSSTPAPRSCSSPRSGMRSTTWPRSSARWATARRTSIPTTASTSAAASSVRSCPDDYQEFVHETFNIPAEPGLPELLACRSSTPACPGARAAVAITCRRGSCRSSSTRTATRCCPTTTARSKAAPASSTCRSTAAGVASSPATRSRSTSARAPAATPGRSIRDDIVRYADLKGDDKIGCAGTVDAYVRGLA